MRTVRKTRSGIQYLVYVTVFRYMLTPWALALDGRKSVNNGRNTTDGLAYKHLTRCQTSYGDGTVVWFASRQPQPAPWPSDRALGRNFGQVM